MNEILASQKNLSCTTQQQIATNNLTPIGFHSLHGENIRITGNGMIAERVGSYCRGICFSNRPVRYNEHISIRIVEMSDFWSGVLRFGFTTKDPSTLRNSLPKYACPNLTNCGHTFAKALPERYSHKNCILSFYLSTNGNVHYSINNVDKGIILENVKINNGPFWAVIDLYGNTQKIELIGMYNKLSFIHSFKIKATGNINFLHMPYFVCPIFFYLTCSLILVLSCTVLLFRSTISAK